MRLYYYVFLALAQKFVLRRSTGRVICWFAGKMGIVYIKIAQILAMQNFGELFTEQDRVCLSQICDDCNPIAFSTVKSILEQSYQRKLNTIFRSIDERPLGSASISQVHRAVLLDGTIVAVKVKRHDVTRHIEHDIRQIRRLIHRFAKFFRMYNIFGSDRALECYLGWIREEMDFSTECANLERYHNFLSEMNQRTKLKTQLVTPKVFTELCTDDVIVMEYISAPTINHLELTPLNQQRLSRAINDYIKLSFYALLHGLPVIFHGDLHSGNLYLTPDNQLGFLDLGLMFKLDAEESALTRDFFILAYTNHVEELVDLILESSTYERADRSQLILDVNRVALRRRELTIAQYFTAMVTVFTQHNVAPPIFLFKMCKSFLALSGMDVFTNNSADMQHLLRPLVLEYYCSLSIEKVRDLAQHGLTLIPTLLRDAKTGNSLESSIKGWLTGIEPNLRASMRHCQDFLNLLLAN